MKLMELLILKTNKEENYKNLHSELEEISTNQVDMLFKSFISKKAHQHILKIVKSYN